jgi:hypothetical protein
MDRLAETFRTAVDLDTDELGDFILGEMLGPDEHDDDVCLLLCRWTAEGALSA